MPAGGLAHLQKQEQRVTASLIQGLNLLSLPCLDMYGYLVELSMSNPMLEIPEPPRRESMERSLNASEAPRRTELCDPEPRHPVEDDAEFDPFFSSGELFEAETLTGSLRLQLSMAKLSPVEEAIGLEIIGDLDESGYFTGNLDTICLLYRQSTDVGKRVLSVIQGFQPAGIAAENVYEALTLQVDGSLPFAELAKKIIKDDLPALCEDDVSGCALKYSETEKNVREAFDYIRTLEPRPGNCDSRPFNVQYTVPDITVTENGGELTVHVTGETDSPLTFNSYYLELMKGPELSADERLYLRQCLNSARSLIHSVDVRRQTLYKAAVALAELQSDFFLFGEERIKPLTMKTLADKMGVNVSTVSRVVQDKYISTPWGIFPLRRFFVRAIRGTGEEQVSSEAAKRRVEELIINEDHTSPLTDDEISTILENEGFSLSRRTVSKYRQEAGIPACLKRKRRN